MTRPTSDPVAAAIHRRRAGVHYDAAVRLERLGLTRSAASARQAARDEDHIAELLERCRS